MAQPDSQRPLGPAVILASLLVLFGGAAYYVMTVSDDAPPGTPAPNTTVPTVAASAPTTAPEAPVAGAEVAPAPDEPETPRGPARAALPVPSASVLAMATAPKVTPEERSEEVLGTLEDARGKFQACTAPWAAQNPTATAKAFFVFDISDEGQASNVSLQFKGVRESTLEACLRNVLRSLSFESAAEKVFWPAALGGSNVFEPLTGADP